MTAKLKPLTCQAARMACDHVGMLALTGEHRAATRIEVDLQALFVEAVALGCCPDPVGVARLIYGLRSLDFPRTHRPTIQHKLEAILGPAIDHEVTQIV